MSGTRSKVLSLYKHLLRESTGFNAYNFRTYAIRRTKDAFKEYQNEKDPKKIEELIAKAEINLGIVKRQAALGKLFAANKLVIEATGILPQSPQNSHAPPST